MPIKARFGVTVCALVRQNLGVGVIDGFTLADQGYDLRVIPIKEDTTFQTYVAFRNDATLSSAAEFFIAALRARMKRAGEARGQVRARRDRLDRGKRSGASIRVQ